MSSMDWRSIVKELTVQGWSVSKNANGHFKAVPPEQGKPIVVIGESNDPRAIKNTIRELRHSGFSWNKRESRPVRSCTDAEDKDVGPLSIAFGATPSVALEAEPMDLDNAFVKLRESKEYYDLALSHERELQGRMAELQAQLDQASSERTAAGVSLRTAKSCFDRLFSVEIPESGTKAAE